jgi:hypothetical protein
MKTDTERHIMPLLNFMKQFVEPIRARTKRHTIRATRKIPIKVGDKLYLYCGARHPGAFRILPEPVACSMVQPIVISEYGMWSACGKMNLVFVDGVQLAPDECELLACADGFPDFQTMMAFWEGRLPFTGQIIHWKE